MNYIIDLLFSNSCSNLQFNFHYPRRSEAAATQKTSGTRIGRSRIVVDEQFALVVSL